MQALDALERQVRRRSDLPGGLRLGCSIDRFAQRVGELRLQVAPGLARNFRVEVQRQGVSAPGVEALDVQVEVPASFEVVCADGRTLVTRRDAVEISYPTRAIGNAAR